MVSAIKGVLLECDIPTKVFVVNLNENLPVNDKFIIQDLDETRLFVQPRIVDWLELKLKEFQDSNTYQAPTREDLLNNKK